MPLSKISPCLWFDDQAEAAAKLYVSLFPNSRIKSVARFPSDAPGGKQAGEAMTVEFELDGIAFTGLNGGPMFQFSEAVSFQVDCADQAEVDRLWAALIEGGGSPSQCGWLKDRFGLSWQIIPAAMGRMMSSGDAPAIKRMYDAMMTMQKLDVARLEAAFAG